MLKRRNLLILLSGAVAGLASEAEQSLRGTLTRGAGGKPAIETGGDRVYLSGDADTMGVLRDERLAGADIEVIGRRRDRENLQVGPIHKKSIWVHRDGRRYMVTYWCEVCAIRTYTPGICQCCQEVTALDLKEEHIHAAPRGPNQ